MAGATVGLPSLTELGQMEFMAPGQFQQAQKQNDLGMQFGQQNLAIGAQDLQAAVLKNLFDSQNNPELLQQKKLQNQGLSFDNTVKGVEAQDAMDPEYRAAKRQKMLAEKSEAELKEMVGIAQKAYLTAEEGSPTQKRAENMLLHTTTALQDRVKHSNEMEKTNATVEGHKDVARIAAGASMYGSDQRVAAAQAKAAARAQAQTDITDALAKGGDAKAPSIYEGFAMRLDATDPELAMHYRKEAARIRQELNNRAASSQGVVQGGKIDQGQFMENGKIVPRGNPIPPPTVGAPPPRAAQPQVQSTYTPPPSPTPAPAGRVDMRAKDGEIGQVLNSELFKSQQRLQELPDLIRRAEALQDKKAMAEYAGEAQRLQSDIAGIQREIGRLPGGRAAQAAPQQQAPASKAPAPALPPGFSLKKP